MKLNNKWREKLFQQAQSLGLSGVIFQNSMDIDVKDLIFELSEIEDLRTKMNMEINQYAASIRMVLRTRVDKENETRKTY